MFKTTKAKIIFVTIFSVICLIITAILILYKNIEIEEKYGEIVKEDSTQAVDGVLGIDLRGTYNQNDLIVEEKKVSKEKVEIRYFQINGLKNKKVENKINKEIEKIALNCYQEEIKDLNEVINISVSMRQASSFANTISFELIYVAKIDDNDDGWYQGFKGINYDLTTGAKINFKDIFTSNASIENILRNSSYYGLLTNRTENNLIGQLIISDYGDIENEIALINNTYKKGKITEFYFTPSEIHVFYEKDKSFKIKMEDYAEYIALYNRYITKESIFEKSNIGLKNLYNLSSRNNDLYYYSNYQKEDNYFIDIVINYQSTEQDEFAKEIVENKISDIEKEIERIKNLVGQNPDNYYILNYYISIYTGEEMSMQRNLTSCIERGNTYEITVQDFKENIEPIIIEYNRKGNKLEESDYIYDFSEILQTQVEEFIEYYDPETKEKIVI